MMRMRASALHNVYSANHDDPPTLSQYNYGHCLFSTTKQLSGVQYAHTSIFVVNDRKISQEIYHSSPLDLIDFWLFKFAQMQYMSATINRYT